VLTAPVAKQHQRTAAGGVGGRPEDAGDAVEGLDAAGLRDAAPSG
jgi:hypothetical protein